MFLYNKQIASILIEGRRIPTFNDAKIEKYFESTYN